MFQTSKLDFLDVSDVSIFIQFLMSMSLFSISVCFFSPGVLVVLHVLLSVTVVLSIRYGGLAPI